MGLFAKTKKGSDIVAIFDIGSGAVMGALVDFSDDASGLPTIIGQVCTDIPFQEELKFDDFARNMEAALAKTAQDLYDLKAGAPKNIFCVLSSPWYISETKIITEKKDKPFVVTKKRMNELIESGKNELAESYKNKYQNSSDTPILIESLCMHSTLNGYVLRDPVGKSAKEININLYVSLSPKSCLMGISSALSKVFHHIPIEYGTYMSSLYTTAMEKYMSATTALLIAIGAEVTDVGIVANGILTDTLSFPCGTNSIKRILIASTGLSEGEISASLLLLSKDILEKGAYDKLLPGLKSAQKEWNDHFKQTLSTLPQNVSLPGSIFMVADAYVAPWFKSIIELEEYVQNVIARKKFKVMTIEGTDLLNICKIKNGGCDQFLMVEAIAYALLKRN